MELTVDGLETVPTRLPNSEDARANAGSTEPITIRMEISKTTERAARYDMDFFLALLGASESESLFFIGTAHDCPVNFRAQQKPQRPRCTENIDFKPFFDDGARRVAEIRLS